MLTPPTLTWFSSIIFIFTCSILVSAAPAIESIEKRNIIDVLFPNYIVPAHQDEPDTAYGTQYTGDVKYVSASAGDEIVLYIGFDVPLNGATDCYIKFRLPQSPQSGWTVTGTGKLSVFGLKSIINQEMLTWNHRPARSSNNALFKITQPKAGGDAMVIGPAIPCEGGQRMDFEVSVTRPGASFFHWYELNSPVTGITMEMY